MVEDESTLGDKNFVSNGCCEDRRESCGRLFDAKLEHLKELFESKDDAAEKALLIVTENNKIHFESLNNVAAREKERDAKFVSKDEFKSQVLNIEQLRLSEAKLAGKADQSAVMEIAKIAAAANTRGNISIIIAVIVFIFSVLIHFIK